jgi:thiamine-phosphate pyrophosphorylase
MEMKVKRNINSGVYLVIDPQMEREALMDKLTLCVQEPLAAIQVWDNFENILDVKALVAKICSLAHSKNIPVLINNRWDLLIDSSIDGVHFDAVPSEIDFIEKAVNRPFLKGITCNNDLSVAEWAEKHEFDYISFCSIFNSVTSNSCELVSFENIKAAKSIFSKLIFLAGGIRPENLVELKGLSFDGVAVVSGIMSSEMPNLAINRYKENLKNIEQ